MPQLQNGIQRDRGEKERATFFVLLCTAAAEASRSCPSSPRPPHCTFQYEQCLQHKMSAHFSMEKDGNQALGVYPCCQQQVLRWDAARQGQCRASFPSCHHSRPPFFYRVMRAPRRPAPPDSTPRGCTTAASTDPTRPCASRKRTRPFSRSCASMPRPPFSRPRRRRAGGTAGASTARLMCLLLGKCLLLDFFVAQPPGLTALLSPHLFFFLPSFQRTYANIFSGEEKELGLEPQPLLVRPAHATAASLPPPPVATRRRSRRCVLTGNDGRRSGARRLWRRRRGR